MPKLAEIFNISIDELFGKEPMVNDICAQFPLRDDDIFRVVVARGKRVCTVNELNNKSIDISFPKNCNETTRQFKVEVYGNISCNSSINGDVVSYGEIECNQINGDIKECRNNISCKGDINGDVNCGNNVICGDNIKGDVICGGSVNCKIIEGNVQCQGNIIYK